jgi:hypothetical protein
MSKKIVNRLLEKCIATEVYNPLKLKAIGNLCDIGT